MDLKKVHSGIALLREAEDRIPTLRSALPEIVRQKPTRPIADAADQPTRLDPKDEAFLRAYRDFTNISDSDLTLADLDTVRNHPRALSYLRTAMRSVNETVLVAPPIRGAFDLTNDYLDRRAVSINDLIKVRAAIEKRQRRLNKTSVAFRDSSGGFIARPPVLIEREQAMITALDFIDKLHKRVEGKIPPPVNFEQHLERISLGVRPGAKATPQ